MEKIKYVPILKANRGEFNGFLDVELEEQKKIFPIFEITIPELKNEKINKESIEKKLEALEKNLLKLNKKVAVTFGNHENYIKELVNKYEQIIPVYNNVRDIDMSKPGEKILRIRLPLMYDEVNIVGILNNISNEIILNLDLDDITNENNLRNSYFEARNILKELSQKNIKNIIILSMSSFPRTDDISKQEMKSIIEYERKEFKIFKNFKKEFSNLNLIYSDYAVTKYIDIIPFDRLDMTKIPEKLKYTLENSYVIFKGENKKDEIREKTSARRLAEEFIETKYFKGEKFSNGSKNMVQFAKSSTNGNAEKLIRIGTTHHLELILKQLSQDF